MASNLTSLHLPPLPEYTLKPLPPLIPGIPDIYLALACPIISYWAVSLFFHIIDVYDLFPQYRLHTPHELLKRNHATRWDVFRDVIIQQVIQTVMGFGFAYFDPEVLYGMEDYQVAVWAQRIRLAQRGIPSILRLIGVNSTELAHRLGGKSSVIAGVLAGGRYPQLQRMLEMNGELVLAPTFAQWETALAKFIYWIAIPAVQLFAAVVILDSWQYFLHRAMHMNHYLYTTFHSRHHRLYVPYAYGALYNHPFEGFLLDTLGTCVAYLAVGMSARQCMIFFCFAVCKTVDDHCGYALPWDPLQHISGNNAAYHDIHHQSWGIKSNFSQPFFTFWDRVLGTIWRGGDVKLRYERTAREADRWWTEQKNNALKAEEEEAKNSTSSTQPNGNIASLPPTQLPTIPDPVDVHTAQNVRRSPRKLGSSNQASLKGLTERVSVNLPSGVPRMESRR